MCENIHEKYQNKKNSDGPDINSFDIFSFTGLRWSKQTFADGLGNMQFDSIWWSRWWYMI